MIKKGILATSMLAALSGCATSGTNKIGGDESISFDSKAMIMLAEASVEARDELRLLAKTRDAKALGEMTDEQKRQRFDQATKVPDGFEQITTIKFTGEVFEATKLISRLSGYGKVLEIGNKPRSPIIVDISQVDKPLINSLREMSMQVGDAATIEVYPSSKQIRVVYTDVDQESHNNNKR